VVVVGLQDPPIVSSLYKDNFVFNIKNLVSLKGHEIWIELANDTPYSEGFTNKTTRIGL
jgi:hypothetical protein